MDRKAPDNFELGDRAFRRMRDALCEYTEGDCPDGGCNECMFDAGINEFTIWLRKRVCSPDE